jgi:hypothetical protein
MITEEQVKRLELLDMAIETSKVINENLDDEKEIEIVLNYIRTILNLRF